MGQDDVPDSATCETRIMNGAGMATPHAVIAGHLHPPPSSRLPLPGYKVRPGYRRAWRVQCC